MLRDIQANIDHFFNTLLAHTYKIRIMISVISYKS